MARHADPRAEADRAGGSSFAERLRSPVLGAWVVVCLALLVFQGLLGHTVPWFSGDLAYHTGVSRTITWANLNGLGPYDGLPSYYGGLLPLVLALARALSFPPETALSVLSWFEPLGWLACAWYFAGAIWARLLPKVVFLVLLFLGIGWGQGLLAIGVNGPNVASQVFWPLYPRDLALMATLLATGAAVRGRWVLTGIACGAAVAAEAQIAVLTTLLAVLGLALVGGPGRVRRVVLSQVVSALVSVWWWAPRIGWTLAFGSRPAAGDFGGDVPHDLSAVVAAFGLVLAGALVGAVLVVLGRPRSRPMLFVLSWAGLSLLGIVWGLHASSELLTVRRGLLLASVPAAALAAFAIASACRSRSWMLNTAIAAGLVAAVVAPSVPTLLETRDSARTNFTTQVAASFAYPDSGWDRAWDELRRGSGTVLAPRRDAAVTWFRTGRPVVSATLPGYVKTWFDVGRATGWSDTEREQAADGAFGNDHRVLCSVMAGHQVADALFRSERGLLGVLDLAGGDRLDQLVSGSDADSVVLPFDRGITLRGGRVTISAQLAAGLARLQVWQAGPLRVVAKAGHRELQPTGLVRDGALTRFDLRLPAHNKRAVTLTPDKGRAFQLARIVGLARSSLAHSGPVTVVRRSQVC